MKISTCAPKCYTHWMKGDRNIAAGNFKHKQKQESSVNKLKTSGRIASINSCSRVQSNAGII